jgi:hypothetical protein
MKNTVILTDTFNGTEISRHRTVLAAVKAEAKHLRAVRKANGRGSYLTYSITRNGHPCSHDEITDARMEIHGIR